MKIKAGYVLRIIDETSVVVPVGLESANIKGIIKLNETGTFLWQLLQNGCDADKLVSKLLAEYDVDETSAKRDVDSFLQKLKDNSLLED